jgi:hypothetical protein
MKKNKSPIFVSSPHRGKVGNEYELVPNYKWSNGEPTHVVTPI